MRSGKLAKILTLVGRSFYQLTALFLNVSANPNLVRLLVSSLDMYIGINIKKELLNLDSLKISRAYIDIIQTFFSNISSLKPVFHFYIYNVNKKIYKNSRGKSGKYTFL